MQLVRAFFHLSFAITAIYLVQIRQTPRDLIGTIIMVSCTLVLCTEVVLAFSYRQKQSWSGRRYLTDVLHAQLESVVRPSERGQLTAMSSYAIGVVLCYLSFPMHVALPGVIILGVGDPAARIVGQVSPIYRFENKKSIGGILGFMGASALLLALSHWLNPWYPLYPSLEFTWMMAVGAAIIVAALVELCAPRFDNLLIPYSAALTIQLMS